MTDRSPLAAALSVPAEDIAEIDRVAWQLLQDRRYAEARRLFRGLQLLAPTSVDAFRGDALCATEQLDHVGALQALEKAQAICRDRDDEEGLAEVLALKAKVLHRSKQKQAAIEAAKEALSHASGAEPWVAKLQAGKLALERQDRRRQSPVTDVELDDALQQTLADRLARVTEGESTLGAAMGFGDDQLLSMFEQGEQLMADEKIEQAHRVFEGLIALEPRVPLFHLAAATAAELLHHRRSARRHFDEAVRCAQKLDADLLAASLLRRCRFRFVQEDFAGAREDAQAALKLDVTEWPPAEREQARELLETLDRLGL